MSNLDLDPARIARAADAIDPLFLRSPQYEDEHLSRRLGRRVVIKDETCNPLRSFKGRGACFMASELQPGRRVVCASSGNFGQAMAYACRRAGLDCTVFLSEGASPLARERIELFGADVVPPDPEAKPRAKAYAAERSECVFVEDGDAPAIAEGAGTIGLELLEAGPLDAVIVQVGDGALIAGIACAIKDRSPATRVIGVCAAGARSMADSWRAGAVVPSPADTIAAGLAIGEPVPESLARLRLLVDDMLLVPDAALLDAMRLAVETTGALVEPSGAAGLAALVEHEPPGERVAIVFTGSMVRPEHVAALGGPVAGERPAPVG